jgi:hypothetical protein
VTEDELENLTIGKLIGLASIHALLALGVTLKIILECHPVTWNTSLDCQTMVTKINSLKVINNWAESGTALMTEYNTTVSKDEEEEQTVCKWFRITEKSCRRQSNKMLIL